MSVGQSARGENRCIAQFKEDFDSRFEPEERNQSEENQVIMPMCAFTLNFGCGGGSGRSCPSP